LENITLTRGNGLEEGTGIYVSAGTLILKKGAVVTGNGDGSKKSPGKTKRGGGVFVAKIASFELDGGEISNNWTGADTLDGGGGGIYIEGTAYFRSGLISNNYSFNDGGGVVVGGDRTVGGGWTGELYMYNGTEVSDNEAADDGGGIKVDYKGRFHMHGGKIVQNTCAHYGGGLRLEAGTVDIRTGSLISGSDRSDQNRAGWGGHAYCRLGPQKHDSTITYAFSDSF
jgi:hypothetical protein